MTARYLYEMLDRLPYGCDDFIVRFTTSGYVCWRQPTSWFIDDDQDLVLTTNDDECMTVAELKDLLCGELDDDVYTDASVYIQDYDADEDYANDYAWQPCDWRMYINWKRERVDVWME